MKTPWTKIILPMLVLGVLVLAGYLGGAELYLFVFFPLLVVVLAVALMRAASDDPGAFWLDQLSYVGGSILRMAAFFMLFGALAGLVHCSGVIAEPNSVGLQ